MKRNIAAVLLITLLAGCNSSTNQKPPSENSSIIAKVAPAVCVARTKPAENAPPDGPAVVLKTFNSGGMFFGGARQPIMWQVNGQCDPEAKVELMVSRNDGAEWFTIGTVDAAKGQVIWNLPRTEGAEYRLKARLMTGTEVICESVSENPFTITCGLPPCIPAVESITRAQTVTVNYRLSPSHTANERQIRPDEISKVVLWVTSDGGTTWKHLGAFPGDGKGIIYNAADGQYGFYCAYLTADGAWTATPTAHSKPQATVVIDSTPPRLELRSPRDGDQFFAPAGNSDDARIPVLWDALDLSLDNRQMNILVSQGDEAWSDAGSPLAEAGIFEVRLKPSEKPYFLKLVARDAAGNETTVAMTQGFKVSTQPDVRPDRDPVLQLLRPLSGEILRGGSEEAVVWKSTDMPESVTQMVVEFYDGEKWQEIRRVSDPSGSFVWQVPSTEGTHCRVRISADLIYKTVTAESENFTIDSTSPSSDIALGIQDTDIPAQANAAAEPQQATQDTPQHGDAATDAGSLIEAVIRMDGTAGANSSANPAETTDKNIEAVASDTDRLQKQRQIDEAFEYLAHENWLMAENSFKALVKMYPDDPDVFYGMGRFYYDQQRYAEAEQELLLAVALNPSHARAQYYLGKISLRSAAPGITEDEVRFTNTEMRFKRAIEADPRLAEALNDLGTLYFEKKNFTDALNYFGRAVDADAGNKIYFYNYGRTAFELGKYGEAIDFCQKALKLDEDFPHPYWFIAKSYTKQRNWAQACIYWQKVIDKFGFDKNLQAQAVIELKNAQEQK
jgi:tetratricopeptide (TPR) repeat protein